MIRSEQPDLSFCGSFSRTQKRLNVNIPIVNNASRLHFITFVNVSNVLIAIYACACVLYGRGMREAPKRRRSSRKGALDCQRHSLDQATTGSPSAMAPTAHAGDCRLGPVSGRAALQHFIA